ncbi:MAG: iron-containing alcohol dehydrogenase [Desulfobacteraceae bacterium]|nr:iron-containing alcohol dehydrogenase [Desulfobacteraceae bacterium]MBU4002925.1 iron-containing alcohol dehydrogenase [Pseudomonadota bacterium]MBU4055515.1 iron-containing alcohol dehydrogenase [Pseudomonadota bacterium]
MSNPIYNISLGFNARFGVGSIQDIGKSSQRAGIKKALIVCDPMMVKIGYAGKIQEILSKSGLDSVIFDQCVENPKASDVTEGAKVFNAQGCDGIIALGGGSPIDQAKGIRIVAKYGGTAQDFNIMGGSRAREVKGDMPPMIAVPTTSGTGSEATSAAVITDTERNVKFILANPFLLPTNVILDPELTVSMPPKVTAATGMDALVHALEAYVTAAANPISDSFGRTTFTLIGKSLKKAVEKGDDLEARSDMSMASLLAGLAFGIAGLGAVHSLAHPLGGRHHIAHGLANSIMLPHVMRYNTKTSEARYVEAAKCMGKDVRTGEEAASAMTQFAASLGLPTRLSEIGIKEADLLQLSKDAAADGSHFRNPVPCTQETLLEMYKQAL